MGGGVGGKKVRVRMSEVVRDESRRTLEDFDDDDDDRFKKRKKE